MEWFREFRFDLGDYVHGDKDWPESVSYLDDVMRHECDMISSIS
jgi:hypothetical protein